MENTMTNVEWVKKFGEPESVAGLGVDWKGYIPSGGWEWQAQFHTEILPRIDKNIAMFKSEMAKNFNAVSMARVLKSSAKAAKKFFTDLAAAWEATPGLFKPEDSEIKDKIFSEMHRSEEVIDAVVDGFRVEADIEGWARRGEEDIKYLEAFKMYFLKDFEFDMLMWAHHHCDTKYFKKVFRASCRLLNEIKELRYVVETSKIPMAQKLREQFKQPVEALTKAYDHLEPMMRKFKKLVAEPDFVPSELDVVLDSKFQNVYESSSTGWSPIGDFKIS